MPTSKGQKRTADFSPTTATQLPSSPAPSPDSAPQIIRRHRHRRRNIAATVWGVEQPPPLTTPSAPLPRTASRSFSNPRAPFNIYKSLLRHPNLFFQLLIRLPYRTIIALYAIDKEFHYRLNKYSVSLIHDYARYYAPVASHVFAWVLFPELCISDPMLRPMDGREWLARDVPGFRWVGMVLWRQNVVRGILTSMAVEGHRVPKGSFEVLCKFWCIMESKNEALRKAFLQDRNIWRDEEILVFQLFLMKLDMRFSDPVLGNGVGELSHLLLTQKGLGMLYRVLTGQMKIDYDKATDIVVRTYLSEDLDTDTHTWLDDEIENGVPEEEWGILSQEGWHMDGKTMDSAVDMVIMEGIRRGLDVQKYYMEFVIYGFVDGGGSNIPVPRQLRQQKSKGVVEVGWPSEKAGREALQKLSGAAGLSRVDEMEADM